LAFKPMNDSLLYVSTLTAGAVVEINYKRKTIGRTFSPGGSTQAVAVSPDGLELYVANATRKEIDIFNLSSGTALTPVATGGGAFDLEVSPDGATLWVSLPSGGVIKAYDRASRALKHHIVTGCV